MVKLPVKTNKKIALQTREDLEINIPAKVVLYPDTYYNTEIPLKLNLSWLPKHVKVYALGRDGKWTCQGNANTPFRINKQGDTECFSVNGKDCLVAHPRSCEKLKASPPRHLKPLACGKEHMKTYGITGYEGSGHWCNTFRNIYLTNARAVLVNEKTHKTLATGRMSGMKMIVKNVYKEFLPLLAKVRRAISCRYPELTGRKEQY